MFRMLRAIRIPSAQVFRFLAHTSPLERKNFEIESDQTDKKSEAVQTKPISKKTRKIKITKKSSQEVLSDDFIEMIKAKAKTEESYRTISGKSQNISQQSENQEPPRKIFSEAISIKHEPKITQSEELPSESTKSVTATPESLEIRRLKILKKKYVSVEIKARVLI